MTTITPSSMPRRLSEGVAPRVSTVAPASPQPERPTRRTRRGVKQRKIGAIGAPECERQGCNRLNRYPDHRYCSPDCHDAASLMGRAQKTYEAYVGQHPERAAELEAAAAAVGAAMTEYHLARAELFREVNGHDTDD